MEILKICNILISQYQLHIFTVVLYYAYQQFKINKRIEVQIQKCNGRFNLQEYKYDELIKALEKQKEKHAERTDATGISGREVNVVNS